MFVFPDPGQWRHSRWGKSDAAFDVGAALASGWLQTTHTKLSTESTWLLPNDMLVGWGLEPRFCSFVFSDEIFKPSGAASALKLDKQDAASPIDGSNSAVSSTYTRSVILELPILIPGRTDMCSKIQSIATQNSAWVHRMQNFDWIGSNSSWKLIILDSRLIQEPYTNVTT